MNPQRTVREALQKRTDIFGLTWIRGPEGIVFEFEGGPDFFDPDCVFDSLPDEDAAELMTAFCDGLFLGWGVSRELSKLLAKRGNLIDKRGAALVMSRQERDDLFCLQLAFLGSNVKWEPLCIRYLDSLAEGQREGLFLACYRLNTTFIYWALVDKFTAWAMEDPNWRFRSEVDMLARFLELWERMPGYWLHKSLFDLLPR